MKLWETGAVQAKYLIRTHSIFKVERFYPETQTVDIVQQVLELEADERGDIHRINEFGIDTPYLVKAPDRITGVPVKQFKCGQFTIQCCPKPGDTGYVEYFQDDIYDWVENGKVDVPSSAYKYLRSSCVFVPGVNSKQDAIQNYPSDNTKLIIAGKDVKIELVNPDGNNPETVINITTKKLNIDSDETSITGDVNVDGKLTVKGDIESTNGDVTAGTISLKTHTHSGATLTTTATVGTGPVGTISGNTDVAQ